VRGHGAIGVEGLALELSDANVPEVVVDQVRNVAALERNVRGLESAREGGDRDEVERQRGELVCEPPRFLDPLLRQTPVEHRVAVHDMVDVEERLPVPDEEEEPHRTSLCGTATVCHSLMDVPHIACRAETVAVPTRACFPFGQVSNVYDASARFIRLSLRDRSR
jgi:hypothetical protein